MFNELIKNKFLETARNKHAAASIFSKSNKYEELYSTDLCMLPNKIVHEIISDIRITTTEYEDSIKDALTEYVSWSKDAGYSVNEDIFELNIDILKTVKESMVSSPMHMSHVLDSVFGSSSEKTSYIQHRCYLWCAFYGVDSLASKYIVEMRNDDFDKENFTISVAGELYEIGIEAWKDFSILSSIDYFNYYHSNYVTQRKRVESDFLFRGTGVSKSGHIRYATIKANVPYITNKAGSKISYNTIYNSGMFYRMFEMERMGIKPDFTNYCIKLYLGGETNIVLKKSTPQYGNISRRRRRLMKDYENWKKAFS